MRTAFALAVCLLLLVPGRTAAAGDFAAALVARAGEDVLGYLRIENPKTLLEKLDAVSARFGSRVSDDLPLFAQRYLKNPLLAGIAMDQPWNFIFLNPLRHTNNLAIVVGVSDVAMFCDSFGKGGVSSVKADPATAGAAVRHFSETEDTYDHQAYVEALRAGKKVEPLQFKKQVTKQYYVTARNGQGVIVGSAALFDKLTPAASNLGYDRVRGDLAAAVRVPGVLSLYEKDIRQRKEPVLDAIQSAARASSGGAATADAVSRFGKALGAGFDVALTLAKQIAWIEAAAELETGQLKLRIAAPPLPGTAFSRALAGQQPLDPDEPLLAVMPANVAMLDAMRFAKTPEWTGLLVDLMQPIVEAIAAANNPESTAKAREALRAVTESCAGGFARAVLTPPTNQPSFKPKREAGDSAKNASAPPPASGFNVVEVLRVTDATQARQARRKAVEAGLPLDGGLFSGPAGKMKYETSVARHAGVEIDRITPDHVAAEKFTSEQPPSENAAAPFIQQIAFVGQLELIAQGPDSTNNIRRLIAAAKKPSASGGPAGLKAAVASFPKKRNGIFYMNLADYVALIRSASPAAAEDAQLRRLQTQLAEAKAMHVGCLILQPRAASLELVIPLDQLLEIMLRNAAPADR
ncbi:MAG: hypothetical protein NT105_12655 [Verrucomicrobia bacterium]|nr:hypothetical protein [Verrucomicrobiota bacterium]